MKKITEAKAKELLLRDCRKSLLLEEPPGGKLKINGIPMRYAYVLALRLVVGKGVDGNFYSQLN